LASSTANSPEKDRLKKALSQQPSMTLPSTLIFDYPNLHKLAHYLGRKIGCLPDDKALSKEEARISEQPTDEDEMESAIRTRIGQIGNCDGGNKCRMNHLRATQVIETGQPEGVECK
jgi:hypothetical protein